VALVVAPLYPLEGEDAVLSLTVTSGSATVYSLTSVPSASALSVGLLLTDVPAGIAVPEDAVDYSKQQHLAGMAQDYLRRRNLADVRYRFDILADYGAFRDLQRHRLMTLEWQRFSTRLGYDLPADIIEHGLADEWVSVMDDAGELYVVALDGSIYRIGVEGA